MKRLLPLILAAALGAGILAVPASSQTDCTIDGTKKDDQLYGDITQNVICAKGGADYVNAKGGNDIARGAGGGDTVVGGDGSDRVIGGPGDDDLFATDDTPDYVDGGKGKDNCYGDRVDTFVHCEHVVKV